MQEINANIIKHRIIHSNISISPDLTRALELNMECRAKLKPPKNEVSQTVLLNIKLNIFSEDELLTIELVSDIIFELDALPESYEEAGERELVPMAIEMQLNSLDEILVIMGYPKMALAQKLK